MLKFTCSGSGKSLAGAIGGLVSENLAAILGLFKPKTSSGSSPISSNSLPLSGNPAVLLASDTMPPRRDSVTLSACSPASSATRLNRSLASSKGALNLSAMACPLLCKSSRYTWSI